MSPLLKLLKDRGSSLFISNDAETVHFDIDAYAWIVTDLKTEQEVFRADADDEESLVSYLCRQ
jgi:hypothetical protein